MLLNTQFYRKNLLLDDFVYNLISKYKATLTPICVDDIIFINSIHELTTQSSDLWDIFLALVETQST